MKLFHGKNEVVDRLSAVYEVDVHTVARLVLDETQCFVGFFLGDAFAVNERDKRGVLTPTVGTPSLRNSSARFGPTPFKDAMSASNKDAIEPPGNSLAPVKTAERRIKFSPAFFKRLWFPKAKPLVVFRRKRNPFA